MKWFYSFRSVGPWCLNYQFDVTFILLYVMHVLACVLGSSPFSHLSHPTKGRVRVWVGLELGLGLVGVRIR